MPWTLVHPAAVLPLRKYCANRHLFGALVVGSVSPDICYYVGRFDIAAIAHTLPGLFTVCLPSGLALLVLIRGLHKPIAELLPRPHRQAIRSLPRMPRLDNPATFLYVSASIIIGAATHNVWDSFTHRAGYIVLRWPPLQVPAFVLGARIIPVYDLLQHASTAAGAMVVVAVYVRWLRNSAHAAVDPGPTSDRWRYALLASLAAISLTLSISVVHAVFASNGDPMNVTMFVVRYVVCATTLFAVTLSAASLFVAYRSRG
jgi:Domain of unknown function (DUF4184)